MRNTPTSFRRLLSISAGAALLSLLPALASAQIAPEPAPAAVHTGDAPGFVTMDRGNQSSFVEVALATSFFEGEDPDFNMRLDLYGQYVLPSGTGGYATLPIGYLRDAGESATGIGNVEVGGLHNLVLNPRTTLVLRGGLGLPTADDDIEGQVANIVNANARITDFIALAPEITALRMAASPIYKSGNIFLRADGGLDVVISSPDDVDIDPLIRINVAAGLIAGTAAIMAELTSIGTTGDVGDGQDRFINSLAISARFQHGGVSTFGALVLPLDDQLFGIDLTLVGGVRIPIGM